MRTDGKKLEGGTFLPPGSIGPEPTTGFTTTGEADFADLIPGLNLSVTALEVLVRQRRIDLWESLEILSAFRLFVSDLYSIFSQTGVRHGEGLTTLNEVRLRLAELSVQGLEGADYSIVSGNYYVHPT